MQIRGWDKTRPVSHQSPSLRPDFPASGHHLSDLRILGLAPVTRKMGTVLIDTLYGRVWGQGVHVAYAQYVSAVLVFKCTSHTRGVAFRY